MEVVPAILATKKEEFEDKLRAVESHVERVHLDIADGIFVPTMTIDVDAVSDIETDCSLWVHLMVSKPEHHVMRWLEAPISALSFHLEATEKALEIITQVKEADRAVGVALNPGASFSEIEPIIDAIDFIQFMTVQPGAYGGAFIPEVLQAIKDFHYFYPDKDIAVDGGVRPETIQLLADAGASIFVVGSYIFQSKDVQKAINTLNQSFS